MKPGQVVGTRRGIGHQGNWKARGSKLWRVVRTYPSDKYYSGICVELRPLDPENHRLHPFKIDSSLVDEQPKIRIEI
jgi:hypothetical protein